ncbi:hypothetical protein CLOP_g15686 [Closterium sp. NIES-67]|nr:hypothetical protein CLOP_g15686 [Closterium sp. NIES-67]
MGKKGKGKPGKGKEKTERKTAKAEAKKQRREEKQVDEEDDVDAILAKIAAEEAKKKEVHVDEGVPPPSPRCNATMVVNPLKDTELVIFGGEFYNGDKTHVYGDLYRFNADKATWRLVSSPNSPPPRSGHHAVAWKNFVFVFGGEFTSPNQERFHHFKDLWRLDLSTNQWEQLSLKGAPSPRSGHRMVLYKQRILLFGGFYDNLRDVRYFNDLHVLDLTDMKWAEVKPKPGAAWPSPRSAFQFAAHQDEVFLYGGYFKDHAKDADGRDRGVVLSDLWLLDPRSFEWNKVKRLGSPPSARAGFSLAVHRSRAILVGGVVDTEEKGGDVLRSIFLDDMFAFQMDARRWFPLLLRSQQQAKAAGRKAELTAGGEVTRGAKSTALADGEDEEESDEETEGRKSMQPGNEADSEEEEEEEVSGRKKQRLKRKERKGAKSRAAAAAAAAGVGMEWEGGEEEWGEGEDEVRDGSGGGGRGEQEREGEDAEGSSGGDAMLGLERGAGGSECEAGASDASRQGAVEEGGRGGVDGQAAAGSGRDEGAGEVEGGVQRMRLESGELEGGEGEGRREKAGGSEARGGDVAGGISEAAGEGGGKEEGGKGERVEGPCGRMNAGLAVGGNTLYLWGGVREVGDREVTLDDLFSLNLSKLDTWTCIHKGSESTWVEEEEEEDDESGEEGSGGEDDEDEDEDENESSDDDASAKGTGSAPTASELAAAVLRGEGPAGGKRQLSRKERRAEIDRIRADLGLADTERTPAPGESLRDFFARTGDHWQREAYQHTQRTGKELRKDGFDLCEARYRDLLPVLTELEKLEAEQKAEEEAEAAVNKGKGKKDKGRPASRR